jgi:hypothetical protein
VADRLVHTPFPTGPRWLTRALVVSAVAHVLAVVAVYVASGRGEERRTEIVDIELAPPPRKAEALPAEHARERKEAAAAAQEPAPPPEPPKPVESLVDAGIPDAPNKPRPDAARDAGIDAAVDVAVDASIDAAVDVDAGAVEMVASGGTSDGGERDGGAAAIAQTGNDGGTGTSAGSDELAVAGEPTNAGTAANLLTYVPAGHVVCALIRFDRLRGTEWAAQTERLLEPLPDYHALFGSKHAGIADKLDTLVISSPRPRDVTATTLVVHAAMTRKQLRELLADGKPITWSAARGGMLGKRVVKDAPTDRRVILSPWKSWFVLSQPEDFGPLLGASRGNLDAIEAKGKLPDWLDTIRTIEKESGEDAGRGPALVVTLAGTGKRVAFPDVGLGIRSLPGPERVSIAVELVAQGWQVRGNLKFASEADAVELVQAVQQAQQRIADSRMLSMVLRTQHVYHAIIGLSLSRTGDRVSYATSASIADARAVLAAIAATLDQYFGRTP